MTPELRAAILSVNGEDLEYDGALSEGGGLDYVDKGQTLFMPMELQRLFAYMQVKLHSCTCHLVRNLYEAKGNSFRYVRCKAAETPACTCRDDVLCRRFSSLILADTMYTCEKSVADGCESWVVSCRFLHVRENVLFPPPPPYFGSMKPCIHP